MYFYVIDSYLQDRKYLNDVARIQARLATLGISGRQEKITILKNNQETVAEAVKRGAKTVVAVGNDRTVTKILPTIIQHGLVLGLIPVGPEQSIAQYLGIPSGLSACDVLSRRIIHRLDVGMANSQYFLLQLKVPAHTSVICDGHYTVESLDPASTMAINNLGLTAGHPDRGHLELVVQSGEPSSRWFSSQPSFSKNSVFSFRQAQLKCQGSDTLLLDGQIMVKTPTTVEIGPKKLEVIVGRARHF